MTIPYSFNLPPEEEVLRRNRTITTYYAQLYQKKPELYKWAGMAAFASFHVGEKLKLWNWQKSGICSLAATCEKQNRALEDDFQVIRIINNKIFSEIGWAHLAFSQLDFQLFQSLLLERGTHPIVRGAFKKLHVARTQLKTQGPSRATEELIWEGNTDILWHEQAKVVQPLFDKLSELFSGAMTFFASFDYQVNHHKTSWRTPSRFFLFVLFYGFQLVRKNNFLPEVTNLDQRWFWISKDLLIKWRKVEANQQLIAPEIELLSTMEYRKLII